MVLFKTISFLSGCLIDAPSVRVTYLKHEPPDAQFANAKEEAVDQYN